ncbi:MAG: ribonuclease III [Dehalococcoidales bacterium]|nr:ribonuclease III [Dehalococcoidales bacterium]
MTDINDLEKALGVTFVQPALLEEALVHSSYINENPDNNLRNNERLEFIGDAVLGLIIAEKIYTEMPDLTEGQMTKARSTLVKGDTLARIAGEIGLGDYLFMGKGEEATGGRTKVPNLEGAMEAVIAAIYLDQGIYAAKVVVSNIFREEWQKLVSQGVEEDYKSMLQEITQAKYQSVPMYKLIGEEGPDHDKKFTVDVSVKGKWFGTGEGKSKKVAETEAAKAALRAFGEDFT